MTAHWVWLAAGAGAGTALDQLTKRWAVDNLSGRGIVPVIEGLFELRLVRNPGGFFSLGGTLPVDVRRWVLSCVALGVTTWLLRLYAQAGPGARKLRFACALLVAGAVGNLIDRVRTGDVVDFLHIRLGEVFHWATFNVADIYIAFGLVLLAAEWTRWPAHVAHPRVPALKEPR